MSEILTAFAAQYDADIETKVYDGVSQSPEAWREYFNVAPTDRYVKNTTVYGAFGVVGQWKDGENLPMDTVPTLGSNAITQVFYGMGFKVSRKLVKYGEISIIMRWAQSLGKSLANTYGIVHGDVLNNAFTTTYTSLGSVALVSASHTASGSGTRSNINASAALTPANLEVLIAQGHNHVNYRGLRDPIFYTKLIIPPSLRRTAVKILQSEGEAFVTDNDINTQRGMMKIIIDPFIDGSTTHYFVQSDVHGLESAHGMLPEMIEYMTPDNQARVYGIAADFGVGVAVEGWEGIAGSQGA